MLEDSNVVSYAVSIWDLQNTSPKEPSRNRIRNFGEIEECVVEYLCRPLHNDVQCQTLIISQRFP